MMVLNHAINIIHRRSFINLDFLTTWFWLAAYNALRTARSYHLNSACPNWHRMPYEQLPFFQKPLHFLFLELVLTAWTS